MAKMGDFFINITTADDHGEGWQKIGEGKVVLGFDAANGEDATVLAKESTADLSQITADLAKLPEAAPIILPYQQKYLSYVAAEKSYVDAKKWIGSVYGVPPHLIEPPSPEVLALRKAIDVLEKKITEMQYGQSQTLVVPIYTPPTSVVYDPGIPPTLSIKQLTVTIRLEE